MRGVGQAGLEYLVTYGWALVLIAVVVGALAFVFSPPQSVSFFSSDSAKILVKGSSVSGGSAVIKFQNITGGTITLTSLSSGGYFGCQANGALPAGLVVGSGGEIALECSEVIDASEPISIEYTDPVGLSKSAEITATGVDGPAIREIASCPFTLNESGVKYVLANDLGPFAGTCITVGADNVILDCQNKKIDAGTGVFIFDKSGVSIVRCELTGFTNGIYLNGNPQGILLSSNNMHSPGGNAIFAMGGNNVTILDNELSNSGRGTMFFSGTNFTIRNNTANMSGDVGFNLGGSSGTFSNNTACNSGYPPPLEKDVYCWGHTYTGSSNTAGSGCGDCGLTCSPCQA